MSREDLTIHKRDVDIHYPELFSKRHSLQTVEFPHNYKREHKRQLRNNKNRYRTQPITFDEIQEVDEENIEPPGSGVMNPNGSSGVANPNIHQGSSPQDLRKDFLEFSRNFQSNRKVSSTKQPFANKLDT